MLVTMALTAAGVIAVAGLAVDLGRVFIVKNEIQVYADAAALAGAMALDGTTTGIQNAASAIAASGNKWNFGTTSVSRSIGNLCRGVPRPMGRQSESGRGILLCQGYRQRSGAFVLSSLPDRPKQLCR